MEKYIYWREETAGLPLCCPVTVIRALDDVNGSQEQQAAWFELTYVRRYGNLRQSFSYLFIHVNMLQYYRSCKLGGTYLPFKSGGSYLLYSASSETMLLHVLEVVCRKERGRDDDATTADGSEHWTDENCHEKLKTIADSLAPVYEEES
jgi:hypothetical protein